MIMRKENAINIMVGDSKVQKLLQVAVTEINEGIDLFVLNKESRRVAL
jgi:hypothetical protein